MEICRPYSRYCKLGSVFSPKWTWIRPLGVLPEDPPVSANPILNKPQLFASLVPLLWDLRWWLKWPRVSCGILLWMQLTLAHIGSLAGRKDEYEALTQAYLERCSAYVPCRTQAFKTEAALLEWVGKQKGRTAALTVLLDERGKQMSSEAMAVWIGRRRDDGAQHVVFAIGPADGWSEVARKSASMLLSIGPMTLAHALARLVIAEQIYRAFTILAGHPYHRQ